MLDLEQLEQGDDLGHERDDESSWHGAQHRDEPRLRELARLSPANPRSEEPCTQDG
jgi:hypothetical protein